MRNIFYIQHKKKEDRNPTDDFQVNECYTGDALEI